jgi:DNA processing protein
MEKSDLDPKAYWIGFNQVKGIGAVRLRGLLDFFGNLETAWQAPADALANAGLPAKAIENLLNLRNQDVLTRSWNMAQNSGVRVVTWEDEDYPRLLKEIDQAPPVLYIRGEMNVQDELAIAIVGTRRVTSYGRQVAEEVAIFLAHNGITVVSGLARGIDAVAHEAAIKAGGRTLAILGSGVDRIYPPEHERLAKTVTEHGALISDYALNTPPDAANFPPRNRIISGLSLGVVVVEAGDESGALITANFAAEQGREVFAVPGNITAPLSKGTNRLIRDGAHPLLKPQDILDVLDLVHPAEKQTARAFFPADEVEANLMRVLTNEALHVDDICAQSGLPIEKVSATLTLMELKGMVRNLGGMSYGVIRENQAEYGSGSE